MAARSSAPTTDPSRSTTTRSAHCSISFSRWVMKITATPLALRSATTFSSRLVSEMVRLDVCSSMMMSVASSDSAFTISIIWHCASERSATDVAGRKSQPRRRRRGSTLVCSAFRSISLSGPPRRGSRPMNTLAATSRLSKRLSSWCTKAMPRPSESCTVRLSRSVPAKLMVPALGGTTPPRIFISVDLPAPFSPMSPTTSPGSMWKLTSLSARTPGYVLEMFLSWRSGSGIGVLNDPFSRESGRRWPLRQQRSDEGKLDLKPRCCPHRSRLHRDTPGSGPGAGSSPVRTGEGTHFGGNDLGVTYPGGPSARPRRHRHCPSGSAWSG